MGMPKKGRKTQENISQAQKARVYSQKLTTDLLPSLESRKYVGSRFLAA